MNTAKGCIRDCLAVKKSMYLNIIFHIHTVHNIRQEERVPNARGAHGLPLKQPRTSRDRLLFEGYQISSKTPLYRKHNFPFHFKTGSIAHLKKSA